MIRRPTRATRTDTLFPTRRSSDLRPNPDRPDPDRARDRPFLRALQRPRERKMGEGGALDGYLGSRRTHPRGDRALSRRCGGSFMKSVLLARYSGRWRPSLGSAIDRRSEEHTSELQSLMRISYAVFCLKKKNKHN